MCAGAWHAAFGPGGLLAGVSAARASEAARGGGCRGPMGRRTTARSTARLRRSHAIEAPAHSESEGQQREAGRDDSTVVCRRSLTIRVQSQARVPRAILSPGHPWALDCFQAEVGFSVKVGSSESAATGRSSSSMDSWDRSRVDGQSKPRRGASAPVMTVVFREKTRASPKPAPKTTRVPNAPAMAVAPGHSSGRAP